MSKLTIAPSIDSRHRRRCGHDGCAGGVAALTRRCRAARSSRAPAMHACPTSPSSSSRSARRWSTSAPSSAHGRRSRRRARDGREHARSSSAASASRCPDAPIRAAAPRGGPDEEPAAARRRLGLHPQRRRLRDDQRPRRRRRRRGARHAAPTSASSRRKHHRRRPAHRRRGGEDRGHGLPAVKIGDVEQAEGRRMGDGDRLAVRPRQHGHRRHRQRQGARHRRLPAVHPDRRRDQSRQLRRPADQHARRGGRHQLADLQPLGRLHGHLVRDPDRRGDARRRSAARQRRA